METWKKSDEEISRWYEIILKNNRLIDPGELLLKALQWGGPRAWAFVKSETGKEGKENNTLNKMLGRRQAARAKAVAAPPAARPSPTTTTTKQARPPTTVATNKKKEELERLARIKERKRPLRASSLPPSSTDTTTITTPSVPADNNRDDALFNFEAEKAPPVAAKTISKGVWESLLSGGTTSPRGDIGDSGTFEHPEGRPDLRRGGLTATTTNTNNKNKKRSDARTNRIVAEYSKIKKSKKKVATNNGKKRTK